MTSPYRSKEIDHAQTILVLRAHGVKQQTDSHYPVADAVQEILHTLARLELAVRARLRVDDGQDHEHEVDYNSGLCARCSKRDAETTLQLREAVRETENWRIRQVTP